jgi:hypothetical protein
VSLRQNFRNRYLNSKEPKVCKREKTREKERKNREKIKFLLFFFEENELPPKNKNKKQKGQFPDETVRIKV